MKCFETHRSLFFQLPPIVGSVFWRNIRIDIPYRQAFQLRTAVTQGGAGRLVGIEEASFGGYPESLVAGVFHRKFRQVQGTFGLLASIDIPDHAEDDLSPLPGDRLMADGHIHQLAVLAPVAGLEALTQPVSCREHPFDFFPRPDGIQIPDLQPADFFQAVAEHFSKGVIGVQNPDGFDIQDDDAVHEMFHKGQRQALLGCFEQTG